MSLATFTKVWKIHPKKKKLNAIQLDIAYYFPSCDISNILAQEKSISEALNKSLDCQSIF